MDVRVAVLEAIADTLLPKCAEEAAHRREAGDALAARFYDTKGSEIEGAVLRAVAAIETRLAADDRWQLLLLLKLLSTRLGTFLLTGYTSPFPGLARAQRERILLDWSANTRLRKAFKGLKALVASAAFTALRPGGASPLLEALQYVALDPGVPAALPPAAAAAEATVSAACVDLSAAGAGPGSVASAAASLAAKGLRVTWPEAAKRLAPAVAKARPHFVVECDAVVVGSGAGGGVAAARLAGAGLRVVVLEKGGLVRARDMPLAEAEAMGGMYEAGGLVTTTSGATSILAGSTLGGGTRVNWCASFPTPPHVRREWAEGLGLAAFGGQEYDDALRAVSSRLSVRATGCQHSATCATLAVGLQRAGARCGEVPRNCLDAQCSGYCCFGCARGYKQDTVNTWLADACSDGARVVTGAWVESVLMQRSGAQRDGGASAGADAHPRPKQALGVLALGGRPEAPLRVAFVAPVVVSSCGALHTPALLLRSGIKCHGNVGSNLRLHPCTCVVGLMPPGTAPPQFTPAGGAARREPQATGKAPLPEGAAAIRCWQGAIMSTFSNEVGDWEGGGYGALLFTPATHPGLFAAAAPWLGGLDFKELLLQYPHACVVLVLVRDSGSGRVTIDRSGRPRVEYAVTPRDKESMMAGMQLGLRSLAAAGAQTVMTLANTRDGRFAFEDGDVHGPGQQRVRPRGGAAARLSDPAFAQFLGRVAAAGIPDLSMPTFSAHQMGTARLGVDPATSVLDPGGECWECGGLYCCDGSAMPTPSGVNPMVTIESVAYMLAGGIAAQRAAAARAAAGGRAGTRRGAGGGAPLQYEEPASAAPAKL